MTARRIVALTGAGVSAESGLGTFRDPGGLWERFDPYELATPEAFERNPAKVQHFYNLRRRDLAEAEPNAAHRALAELEGALAGAGGELVVVTQNIDNLHERAGSRNIIHMHGEILRARCTACGATPGWREDISAGDACPGCGEMGFLRPHVVWFGEMPLRLDDIAAAIAGAELFVAIGTSGEIYPAAGYVQEAKALGVATVELNKEPSANAAVFDETRYGPASEVVPAWTREVMAGL
ncbi:MAG: NAD-dependent deacylase [Caulobacterales bacterium]|nr:NAD-dependent deacylase [Caulobacterales bacterium]